jgi:hypothetical protein
MPVLVNCPHCDKKLKVPDNLLGKMVKCPTCTKTFTAEATDAPPTEEEEAPRPSDSVTPQKAAEDEEDRPRRRAWDEDEDEDEDEDRPPRRRVLDEDEDEDEDRPRRRRSQDDDEDRPRRRRRGVPHRGTMVLVLGILSIVTCLGVILGPISWVMGNNDLREMRAGRMDREGEGTTNAGKICGIVGTVLGSITAFCCVGYFLLIAIFAASNS